MRYTYMMQYLLHRENYGLAPFRAKLMESAMEACALRVYEETISKIDPNVSIVIRTKNDMAYIAELLRDIASQEYGGSIEIIVVDTSSTDGTAEYVVSHGAKLITILQADFSYPKALNLGFAAAKYNYVVTIVGHSSLTSKLFLKSLTRWYDSVDFGGVHGFPLANWNASRTERLACSLWLPKYMRRAEKILKPRPGLLGANSAILSRDAWERLHGFDEQYAGGGEDSDLGGRMLESGLQIIRDPLCTVFHSHHLGPVHFLRQLLHWHEVANATPFNHSRILARRPDLRK